jgi:pimeloyl-ACP methyl ester carboxylesterase
VELVKRGIAIACAPGFAERQPEVVEALMAYRFSNPVPPPQYQAQVAAGAGMSFLDDEQVTNRMANIHIPTLILFGEHDMVVPSGNAELLKEKIANSSVQLIPEAGHIFPIEAPETTVEILIKFLEG